MSTVKWSVVTLLVNVAAGALLLVCGMTDSWGAFDAQVQQKDRECHATWCLPGQVDRDADAYVASQVAELTAGRDCWTGGRKVWPSTVLVHSVGSTLVREVPVQVGWVAASRGQVVVDAMCA